MHRGTIQKTTTVCNLAEGCLAIIHGIKYRELGGEPIIKATQTRKARSTCTKTDRKKAALTRRPEQVSEGGREISRMIRVDSGLAQTCAGERKSLGNRYSHNRTDFCPF